MNDEINAYLICNGKSVFCKKFYTLLDKQTKAIGLELTTAFEQVNKVYFM